MTTNPEFETLQKIVKALPQAAVIVDGHTEVLADNRAARELCGIERTVHGRRLRDLLDPAQNDLLRHLAACRRTDQPVPFALRFERDPARRLLCWATQVRRRSAGDGRELFLLRFGCDAEHGNRFEDLTLRVRDLHEEILMRKEVEAERNALLESERVARGEAERANRMKDEFLATVSHELRTPLHAVVSWAQLIMDQLPSGTQRDAIEAILRNARAQARLVNDLLELSQIITGKYRMAVEPVRLAEVAEAAFTAVRQAAASRGIHIAIEVAPDLPIVSGDADRLQQVLWNLLSNAVKFSPEGGRVQVTADRRGNAVAVVVRDEGEGIQSELLPFIFDRFRQVDASSTRRHGGLGLGLSISKLLVELHGGSVRAENATTGPGAVFTVTVPVGHSEPMTEPQPERPAAAEGAPETLPRESEGTVDGLCILLVDDHVDSRRALERLLRMLGAEVVGAGSSLEGLRALETMVPDVVLSDLAMPGEDGFAFVRRIRALPDAEIARVPTIALTAYARREDRARALAAGFDQYLAKPVEKSDLVEAICGVTGRAS